MRIQRTRGLFTVIFVDRGQHRSRSYMLLLVNAVDRVENFDKLCHLYDESSTDYAAFHAARYPHDTPTHNNVVKINSSDLDYERVVGHRRTTQLYRVFPRTNATETLWGCGRGEVQKIIQESIRNRMFGIVTRQFYERREERPLQHEPKRV